MGSHKASIVFFIPKFVDDEAQRTLESEESKSENCGNSKEMRWGDKSAE